MKIAHKHISALLPEKPNIHEISEKLFQLGHEHEIDNDIFDLELTPNRGDCLSVNGLLQDLRAFYKVNLNREIYNNKINTLDINFINKAKQECPKISFLKIQIDNDIKPYNGLLKSYFDELKIKPNNLFTDISNYISYETGQPTHCYDADKIGDLVLENTEENVEFHTLLDKKIKLNGRNLVFKTDNNIINLAGVMGDMSTSCNNSTRSVIVECAYFLPENIIGQTVKYDIKSEAAYKFERGTDPCSHELVLRRFIKIVEAHANIKNVQLVNKDSHDIESVKITADTDRISSILGLKISDDKLNGELLKLGFEHKDNKYIVPSHRADVCNINDIAEEVARIIGYNNIPVNNFEIPEIDDKSNDSSNKYLESAIKDLLSSNGFHEVINNPFTNKDSKDSILVDNPLDSNKKYLRTSTRESLIDNLIYNQRRQNDSIKLYEISDIYKRNEDSQSRVLGIICSGRVDKNYIDFSKKIDTQYLRSILDKVLVNIDFDIEIIPKTNLETKSKNEVIYVEINLTSINYEEIKKLKNTKTEQQINFVKYSPISEYPSSSRDLSFSIKNVDDYDKLQNLLSNFDHELIKDKFVFDFFKNEKKQEIKIGYRFIFQSKSRTIMESEVNEIIDDITKISTSLDTVDIPGLNN